MALHQEWIFYPPKFQVNRPSTFRVMDVDLRGLHLGSVKIMALAADFGREIFGDFGAIDSPRGRSLKRAL